MKERKAFNFYKSYYEIAKELPKKYRGDFLMAIIEFQFTGKEPNFSENILKISWAGQKHSLKKQLNGYKCGLKGGAPPKGGLGGGLGGNPNQVQVQEKEQEQEYKERARNFFKRLRKDSSHKELMAKTHKISIGLVETKMQEWGKSLVGKSMDYLNYLKFRDHFTSWLNLNMKNSNPKNRISF